VISEVTVLNVDAELSPESINKQFGISGFMLAPGSVIVTSAMLLIHSRAQMPVLSRGCVVWLLIVFVACDGHRSPTAPSPAPSPTPTPMPSSAPPPPPTSTFHVTGVATDDDSAPVPGATVTVNPCLDRAPSVSDMTDGGGSYKIDFNARGAPGRGIASLIGDSPVTTDL
jgi:hypothetical protein